MKSLSDPKRGPSSWQNPIVFTKASQSVVGPGAAIKYPHGWSDHVDYEAGERLHRFQLKRWLHFSCFTYHNDQDMWLL